jgi:hypothetical protein
MTNLELNDEECATLKQLLENCLTELQSEIINTDNIDYKIILKKRKAVLKKLQKSLSFQSIRPESIIE